MTTPAESAGSPGLYRLLAWASPSFPTGAFSYSHGLEAAIDSGAVHDRASLEAWVTAIVARGGGRIDTDILREAYRAAAAGDAAALDSANRRGLAYRGTAELALESQQQGEAFFTTCRAAWPEAFTNGWARHTNPSPPFKGEREGPGPERRLGEVSINWTAGFRPACRLEAGGPGIPHLTPALCAPGGGEGEEWGGVAAEGVCHSAAFGTVAARAGIPLEDALVGYLQAFAGNLVSAGIRLAVIGQTDGQRILAALEPVVTAAAAAAMTRDAEDFGAAAFAADLASMAHETQYSRLFRS